MSARAVLSPSHLPRGRHDAQATFDFFELIRGFPRVAPLGFLQDAELFGVLERFANFGVLPHRQHCRRTTDRSHRPWILAAEDIPARAARSGYALSMRIVRRETGKES